MEIFFKNYFVTSVDHDVVFTPPTSLLLFYKWSSITILLANTSLETELLTDIRIYNNKQAIEKIT